MGHRPPASLHSNFEARSPPPIYSVRVSPTARERLVLPRAIERVTGSQNSNEVVIRQVRGSTRAARPGTHLHREIDGEEQCDNRAGTLILQRNNERKGAEQADGHERRRPGCKQERPPASAGVGGATDFGYSFRERCRAEGHQKAFPATSCPSCRKCERSAYAIGRAIGCGDCLGSLALDNPFCGRTGESG
jgi:hypothetical protein